MTWRQAIGALLKSGTVLSMFGGVTGTGVYVSYTDWTRYRRTMVNYAAGNILPPMAENTYETVYFPRPELEQVPACAVHKRLYLSSGRKAETCIGRVGCCPRGKSVGVFGPGTNRQTDRHKPTYIM